MWTHKHCEFVHECPSSLPTRDARFKPRLTESGSMATLTPVSQPSQRPPVVLLAGLAVVAAEAAVLVVYAVLEALSVTAGRITMGLSTTLFFVLLAGALLLCAGAVLRRRSWGRSPLVLSQLIALGLAWSFRGGATTWVAAALAAGAAVVLVAVLHPASLAWLSPAEVDD